MYSLIRTIIALALFLSLLAPCSNALLHDKKRGMNVRGVSPEEQEAYIAQHSTDAILSRHKNKEELSQHPDVQTFLRWQEDFKAGNGEAGAAFTGKIPHSYLQHLHEGTHVAESLESAPELKLEL